jgi:predicted homoserine dehydrogenase-like protein
MFWAAMQTDDRMDFQMNLNPLFSGLDRPVEACVIGAGDFGRSFLAQGMKVPMMRARVAVDLDAEAVARLFRALGVAADRIRVCRSVAQADQAWAEGAWIAADDIGSILQLPLDVVVEATGNPEAGARHALLAVEAGKHVALVSKEVDSVVGPVLTHLARERGNIVTPVDGDQPSLLIGLIAWAETLGFEIVAAGKSSEYDFVFDPATGVLSSNGIEAGVPAFAAHLELGARASAELIAVRSKLAARFPQHAVPDLCELQVVANATGFAPDTPALHAPIARIPEVPSLLCTRDDGGVLSGIRRLDVFHCLRTPGEVSFAGGVFVIVRCEDKPTWAMLQGKGHILSRNGNTAMLYLPRHLLGLEAATSVIAAALGRSTGGSECRPRLDLIPLATQDLPAGTVLTAKGHHHSIDHVTAELVPAAPLAPDAPVPFYLAANRRLLRTVSKGKAVVLRDLEPDSASTLMELRRRQDRVFFPGAQA